MRHLFGFIFFIVVTCTAFSQNSNSAQEKVDTIIVMEKTWNYRNLVSQTRTYSLIKKEFGDSLLTFNYLGDTFPNGEFSFDIRNGLFKLVKLPETELDINCVDSVEIQLNGIDDIFYKYEPTELIDDGDGCVIFSKIYGIVASSSYSQNVRTLVSKWDDTEFKLDTLLNYNSVNLLKNNKIIRQPPADKKEKK